MDLDQGKDPFFSEVVVLWERSTDFQVTKVTYPSTCGWAGLNI